MYVSGADIRQRFLDFFKSQQHEVVASSPLVLPNDPTLLFANAGMNQFKNVFLGYEQRPYKRATSVQKCVRAGGKHNDLENVGYTARHHTFFEMLGNFSFGDYFKKEAITLSWQFLTQILQLPAEKLWVTVFKDDIEAEQIWLNDIKVDPARFSRLGEKDNFWAMGDVGPCGPCSEIFYDHGEEVFGDPPGGPNDDGDRYVEIWNMVFMQYNRDEKQQLHKLPKPCVDTGMGLERIAAVMQGVVSNYETDLFIPLLKKSAQVLRWDDIYDASLKVIADHIRSSAFLIADGVYPQSEGRGYILRRIIRRALRHGHKLGCNQPFFYLLADEVIMLMNDHYPELAKHSEIIKQVIKQEEIQFSLTLDRGMQLLEHELEKMINAKSTTIPGDVVFKLYDTYGFPVDLTMDIARERGMQVDLAHFEKAIENQRIMSRAHSQFNAKHINFTFLEHATNFKGYETLTMTSVVQGLYIKSGEDIKPIEKVDHHTEGQILLVVEATPFYAESGGQVADQGQIVYENGFAQVVEVQKFDEVIVHYLKNITGVLTSNTSLQLMVDANRRKMTACNHSATHLLHASLRKVLGEHVQQKGSLVDHEKLRFDFSHPVALTQEELLAIQKMVNEHIMANTPTHCEVMALENAKQQGVIALFTDKYQEQVRVLTMGKDQFSKELCGGTHIERTGDIGSFVIIEESGIASGIRRIEALTGINAYQHWVERSAILDRSNALLKANDSNILNKIESTLNHLHQAEEQSEQLKKHLLSRDCDHLIDYAIHSPKGVKVLMTEVHDKSRNELSIMIDQLKNKLGKSVVVLISADQNTEKMAVVVGVSSSLTKELKASTLIKKIMEQIGGKGGGKADFAQGAAEYVPHINHILANQITETVSLF